MYASATKRSYNSHLKMYFNFCDVTGLSPIPVTTKTLGRYAAHLASKLSYPSVSKYLNIIRILHLEAGLPNPMKDNWYLTTVLKGIKKDKGIASNKKEPITPHILLRIRALLNLTQPKDIVFWAACVVAFFGLLRKSSLVPPSPEAFDCDKFICIRDIVPSDNCVLIRIKWSKTIQHKERQYYITMLYLVNHPLCPVTALVAIRKLKPTLPPNSPIFSFPTPMGVSILTQYQFTSKLKACINSLGLTNNYSGHSFRRGGASWAFSAGLPGEVIQILGDWKSDAYKLYLSLSNNTKLKFSLLFSKQLPTSL